jgi:hypothetical protein
MPSNHKRNLQRDYDFKNEKIRLRLLLGDSSVSVMSCYRSVCGGALEKEEISIAFVSEKADYRRDE